ncbi:rho GTPase-activating protein 45-like isoform X5 [Carassius gibelio]|uniref:rho GTPase-activating protein 45-like isoform X5 n=1 Tax=Carassius gibelio TaxID=101364 RepID=UPI002278FF89|nr:rho GTPase-activating protein 45-like isoform X5 [Carassius gibelio]
MFSRKKKEPTNKASSPSKKSNPSEHCPNDTIDGSCTLAAPDPGPVSCPGTPAPHSKLTVCSSPVGTLKRPSGLSRHASAAGLAFYTSGTWGFHKGYVRAALSYGHAADCTETSVIEVEDIPSLLRDVARFAEAVEKLKDMVLGEVKEEPCSRPAVHECLGEVLRVLRQVISTYPLLNTVETLTAAGTLISKVKGFSYEGTSDAQKKDFEKAIETIAVAFSSNVSELLMGEIDSTTLLSLPPTEKSRSMEDLYRGSSGQGPEGGGKYDHQDCTVSAQEVDILLQRSEGGVDSALNYAKSIAKYMKDIISYVDKRIALENEFSKGLQRLYQSCKQNIIQEHMPLLSIISLALEQDSEQSSGLQQATNNIYTHSFLQPMTQRRQEHEKKRRDIKEQWQRAKRKLADAESNLRKARHLYMSRCEEYERARTVANKVEEEQTGTGSGSTTKALDKKRRLEEEARNKAEEAEATYRTCIADATTQQQELEDMKVNMLKQIQELIRQTDQILRACTISYYQTMHVQTAALPVHFQTLCESCKLYDPGQQYASYVKNLQLRTELPVQYQFEPYSASSHQHIRTRNNSLCTDQRQSSSEAPPTEEEAGFVEEAVVKQRRSQAGRDHHQAHKSWPSTLSDSDSVGPGSALGSPTSSTGDISKPLRPVSAATLSSNEDLEERDGAMTPFEQSINGIESENTAPTGPFRNVGLSRAAKTHRLRKLRTPSKCRECDSYVYFQGAECEECFLACHKKCLESLAIQCGHKKLQGRLQLFGRDFSQVLQGDVDAVPFIIKKCITEIERRALKMKGIYRVNGVKTRVEKLCQAFENGKELVELSQASPHDISNVLKLYLRQLPEPIMPFRIYNELMGLAKESLTSDASEKSPELVDRGSDTEPEVLVLVEKLRELLERLPPANIATLKYIVKHLCRVSELEQDNKMSASNLGIVFGPTLMRPRPTGATVSLSSLVDYPHQARIVETLIVFQQYIFISSSSSVSSPGPSQDSESGIYEEPNTAELECGGSVGSSGSQEDSDSDVEDLIRASRPQRPPLVSQESETSTEEDQTSPRASLDLSALVPETIPEQTLSAEPQQLSDQ